MKNNHRSALASIQSTFVPSTARVILSNAKKNREHVEGSNQYSLDLFSTRITHSLEWRSGRTERTVRVCRQDYLTIFAMVLLLALCHIPISAFDLYYRSRLSPEEHMKLTEFYRSKRVLVTGGCGFIGSHIAEKLVSLGARVTIIDDLSTGFLDNIQNFKNNLTFINKNIADKSACNEAVEGNEIIFHLAAYISVPGSVKDPELCHATNIDGVFNMLNAARVHHVKRFVFSSTSAVYGPREDVCSETDTNLNPISPYGATKLMGELYCKQFSLLFDVPCVMLRYFNVYGPRQNPHSAYAAVVAKFTEQMQRNEPITIFGDGSQTRDFVHVSQVVEANLLAGMAPQESVNGQVYNIATGTSISVLDLAQSLKTHFPDYQHEPRFMPARNGDVLHTAADCTKFKALMGQIQ